MLCLIYAYGLTNIIDIKWKIYLKKIKYNLISTYYINIQRVIYINIMCTDNKFNIMQWSIVKLMNINGCVISAQYY